jgi:uncharacterized protein YndB with AHSA1/START domain
MSTSAVDLARTLRAVWQTGETFGVLLQRSFPAAVDQLWRTCTENDPLSRWLGRIEGDPQTGAFTLVLAGGAEGDVRTQITVLRCDPPNRLDLQWSFDEADSVVSVRIEPDARGARLTLEHYAHTEESGVGYGPGWEEFLADLEDVLAGRPRSHDCGDLERECQARWQGLPRTPDLRFGELDRSRGRYTVRRRYPVATHRLWTALGSADGLSSWFGDASGRFEPGGDWRIDFSDGHASGHVQSCDPGRSFRTTYRQGVDDDSTASHHIEVDVEAVDGGSRLTLTHVCPPGSGERLVEGIAGGWVAHLNGLGSALEGSPPDERDWLADFAAARMVHRRGKAAATGGRAGGDARIPR